MKVVKSEIIELSIPISSTNSRLNISQNLSNLNGAKTMGISASSLTAGNKSLTGQPLLNQNAFKSAYLVLVNNNQVEIAKIPLVELEFQPQSSKRYVEFEQASINWSKSYVQFGDTGALSTAAVEVVQLIVYFV